MSDSCELTLSEKRIKNVILYKPTGRNSSNNRFCRLKPLRIIFADCITNLQKLVSEKAFLGEKIKNF